MYFSICDDYSIRNYMLKGKNSLLIRILEPSYDTNGIPYQINNIEQYKNVLELYIYDTIDNYNNQNTKYIFNYEHAKILNDFIITNDFDEVVVHCSLGISRSPAIMICIAKILGNSELENIIKEKYKFYNLNIVDTFENYNYCIKITESINEIDGNILNIKSAEKNNYVLEKIIKLKV